MKSPFVAICLTAIVASGCSSTNWERALGGHTVNRTECIIADSATNRFEAAQIAHSLADRYYLLDTTEKERQRVASDVVHLKGYDIIAQYLSAAKTNGAEGIKLCVYTWQGNLITSLTQSKWRKTRTLAYAQIQDTLEAETRTRLGKDATIKAYDEGPK
jgi:hypothetical protein